MEGCRAGEKIAAERTFAIVGAILAALGVAAGAFGAHSLKNHFDAFPDFRTVYKTAVDYHLYHAIALFVVAWAMGRWPSPWISWAGYLFVVGIMVFSGSLYVLSLTGIRWMGAITPLGGLALLAGWTCLAAGIWTSSGQ